MHQSLLKPSALLLLLSLLYSMAWAADEPNARVATAGFTFVADCEDDEVVFTNTSSTTAIEIVFYSWDFDDGSGSTARNPRHVFDTPGVYQVTLTIQDSNGDTDSHTELVTIKDRPAANMSVNAADFCTNTAVTFTNLTTLAIGSIDSYTWDFGDGSAPVTTTNASHAYATAGTYTVTLTALANGTCTDIATRTVTIDPRPVTTFTLADACLGDPVNITNLTTITEGNLQYNWTFGDGGTSTRTTPVYSYAAPGDYDINLVATSTEGGCATDLTLPVTIHPRPEPAFSYTDHCFDTPPTIVNSSSISVGTMTFAWDFGDGTSSTDQDPNRSFTLPGAYEVALTAISDNNCVAAVSDFVRVFPEPTARFTFDNACQDNPVPFANASSIESGSLSYAWLFGDGGSAAIESPAPTYTIPNTYPVSLTVTSDNGCTDNLTQDIIIHPTTVGGTIAGSQTICSDDNSTYQLSLSSNTGEVLRWERSTTGDEPWEVISSTTSTLSYSNLGQSNWFRAVVQSGVCAEAISDTALVTVDAATQAGTLSGEATVCFGTNSGDLTLSGNVGSILEWQRATTAGGPWTSLAVTANTFTYTNLQQDTWYRVRAKNGVCNEAFSNEIKITVSPATVVGALAASGTFCRGDNAGTLRLSGYTGDILRWESSNTGDAPWASINNTTDSLAYTDLLATTFYRAIVQSGVCEEIISNAVQIAIDEPTLVGTLSGTSQVCAGLNSGALTLSGNRGTIVQWESSPDQLTWTVTGNTGSEQRFTNLGQSTWYRVLIQNGVCPAAYTLPFRVNVDPLPVVNYMAASVCEGTQTQFTNTSTLSAGTLVSYFWDFGAGQVSVASDPIFRFETSGTYPVKLRVSSSAGCQDSLTASVQVFENPMADFVFSNVCLGFDVRFTNNSLGGGTTISTYAWDFGDGDTSTMAEPVHRYTQSGTYNVSLLITNANGCTDQVTRQVTIYEPGQASFTAANVCDGQDMRFINTSDDPEEEGSHAWSFGDGTGSTALNPVYQYDRFGSYTVNLQLTTANGCISDSSLVVEVYEQPEAGFRADNVCFGTPIAFEDTTIYSQADLSYAWAFGNGDTSTEPSPQYNYPETGKYRVNQSVISASGCSSSAFAFFDVEPIPEVRFLIAPACEAQAVRFTNLTGQSIAELSYAWDFGDGNTASGFEPVNTYSQTGDYPVSLTVTSAFGCSETVTDSVTVFPLPAVAFDFNNVCDGFSMQFINQTTLSAGVISEYLWDFGDFTNSILLNPEKSYLNSGSYEVTLTALSDRGCTSAQTQTATVYANPVADFTADSECFGVPIAFQNFSRGASAPLRYDWQFSDGGSSLAEGPEWVYDLPGTYEVQLTVASPEGCQDSVFRNVAVFPTPVVTASGDTSVSRGFTTRLLATGGANYIWSPASSLDNSNTDSPVARPLETTTYIVIGQTLQGCESTDTITVAVDNDFLLQPNNTFTPDGNGKNDTWVITNVDAFGSATVRVYDRTGKLMFEQEGYQNDWEGTVGGDLLPDGTYFYLVTFADSDQRYKGTLTIIRNE